MNVLITGASRGIGNAIFNKLSNDFFTIGTSTTGIPPFLKLDINNIHSIEKIWKTLDEVDIKIDVLINNAGISQRKEFIKLTYQDITNMLNTNLVGTMMMTQEFIKRNRKGKIVNIASIGGVNGGIEQAHYAASKAGIINFTKSIVKAYPSIKCNCISPGIIRTDMIDTSRVNMSRIPMARVGEPQEVANLVKFLIDDTSDYIQGQNIIIDGGITL